MKRILSVVFAAVVLISSLVGCSGVSQEEYDALLAENTALQAEKSDLNEKCESLEKDYSELSENISELQLENTTLKNENQQMSGYLDTGAQIISLWDIDTCMLGRPETAVYSHNSEQVHESISTEKTFYLEDDILSGKLVVTFKNDMPLDEIATFIKSNMDSIYSSMKDLISEKVRANIVIYRYENGDVIMVYYHYYDTTDNTAKSFSGWRPAGMDVHSEYAKLVE